VLAAAQGSARRAIDLAEAAAGLREVIGARISLKQDTMLHRWLGPVRQILEAESTPRGWKLTWALPIDDAVELALSSPDPVPAHVKLADRSSADREGGAQSPREMEVAGLVRERRSACGPKSVGRAHPARPERSGSVHNMLFPGATTRQIKGFRQCGHW
jgi:hypothetical protein